MAPTSVIAKGVSCQSVTVHWTPPTNNERIPLNGYTVRYGIDNAQIMMNNATSLTIEGLTPNTTYNITVAAWNAIGEGITSQAFRVSTEPRRQGTFVSAQALTSDKITINTTEENVEEFTNITCFILSSSHQMQGPFTPPVTVAQLQPDTYYTLVCNVYNSALNINPCVDVNTSVLTSESG